MSFNDYGRWQGPTMAEERKADAERARVEDEREALALEIVNAVEAADLSREVRAPTYEKPKRTYPLKALLAEHITESDDTLKMLAGLWAASLKSADPAVRLPAQAALAEFAKSHADFYSEWWL